jgi:hypothetical protein
VPPGYPPTSGVPLGYPGSPGPPPGPRQQAPIPPEARRPPSRVEPVPGTSFGVAYLDVPAATSGTAVSSMVTGIASILVSFVVTCFGLAGASAGWGGWVAGAFAVLAILLGLAAIGLGLAGLRQVRRARERGTIRVGGRGLAITGLACGGSGIAITVLALVATLLIQFG